jgi:lipopolysaccharide export system protein LptA
MAFSGDVRIFMQGQAPPEGYVELGIIQADASGFYNEMPAVIESLQKEARSIGGNAVINVRVDQGTSMITANGVCVRYP